MNEVAKEKLDGVFFGGDIVGYGAHPKECAQLVKESGHPCVLGNHDSYVIEMEHRAHILAEDPEVHDNPVWMGILHSIQQTKGELLEWLRTLPFEVSLPGAQLAHAALHDQEDWPYLSSPGDATPTLALLKEPVGFFGHTHQTQLFFDRAKPGRPKWIGREWIEIPKDGTCAVTVGSVGQPRDGDHRSGWVIWDSDLMRVQLRKTEYPEEAAAYAIIEAGLPSHSARRLLRRGAHLPWMSA